MIGISVRLRRQPQLISPAQKKIMRLITNRNIELLGFQILVQVHRRAAHHALRLRRDQRYLGVNIRVAERIKAERINHRPRILRRFRKHRPVHNPTDRPDVAILLQLRRTLNVINAGCPRRDEHIRRTARLIQHMFKNVDHRKLTTRQPADLIASIQRPDCFRRASSRDATK